MTALSRTRRPAPRRGGGSRSSDGRWALLFLGPTLLGLAVLSAGPILATLALSLTDWDLLTAPKFSGLDNYLQLISDHRFQVALRNTFFYTVVSVPLGLVIALGLAMALNTKVRGIAFIRTAYFLPVVTSTIAIALVWQWIYSANGGLLNEILGSFGIPTQKFLSDPTLALPAIIAMSIWQGLGINIIIFLAGLQGIPSDLLDAASVDGAGSWARFRNVTLPLLTPSIFFTTVLSLISGFQVFDQIYVLAKPKPTEFTITVVYFIYENGFKFFKMGYASAASWILFLIVALFTAIYFWSQNRWVHYQ